MRKAAAVVTLALLASAAWAGARAERKGVLAGLPSAPGPHIERIKALGDHEWLGLGPPAPDPKWGRGRGRSWSSRMPHAPELAGAFLHGQGVHGYIKPDGYFMDDIWFYDLNGHRWLCLYPGTNTRTFVADILKGELKLNDDGQLVDKEGRVVPFSSIAGHSYQDHAYAPELGLYVFGGHGDGIGSEQHVRGQEWCKKGRELLLAQRKTDRAAGAPYWFNTLTGTFERPTGGSSGRAHGGAGGSFTVDLYYLPTKKVFWQHQFGKVWLSDPATHKWIPAQASGPPPRGGDVGACYDSKRDRIYIGGRGSEKGGGGVHIYDVKANAWSNPPDKAGATPWPGANRGCVHYDAAADRVLAFHGWNSPDRGKGGGIAIYEPETGSWEAPLVIPANVVSGCVHGFYSPEVNAHFFFVAGDSRDDGAMWVYRYKRAAGNE